MYQLAQCPNCPHQQYVDLNQIARGISRHFCPACGALADYAEEQQANPFLSQGTRDVWGAIAAVAIVAGLFIAAHAADQFIQQLRA